MYLLFSYRSFLKLKEKQQLDNFHALSGSVNFC